MISLSKKTLLYRTGAVFAVLALSSTLLSATAKTLPKGVWKFDLQKSTYDYVYGGVNPSGNFTNWETRTFDTLRMSDFAAVQGTADLLNATKAAVPAGLANNLTTIDTNVPVADYWTQDQTHFNIAYGITDKFTIFANLTHEKGEVDYEAEYEEQSANIERNLGVLADNLTGTDAATFAAVKAAYNQVPDKATSDHLRDTFVGFKYSISERLAFTTRVSAGFLLTGRDSSEKRKGDLVQELETGFGYDMYQFFLNYDAPTKRLPLMLTLGYFHNTQGPHAFLDITDVTIDYGDIIYLKAATEHKIHPTIVLEASAEHMISFKDRYKGNGTTSAFSTQTPFVADTVPTTFTDIPHSAGYATIGTLGIRVMPKEFLYFYARASKTFFNKKQGQNYDFPGRLQPGTYLLFGTTLFFKAS